MNWDSPEVCETDTRQGFLLLPGGHPQLAVNLMLHLWVSDPDAWRRP